MARQEKECVLKSEAEIKAETLEAVSKLPTTVLWNNPRGTGWQGQPGHRTGERLSLLFPRAITFGGPPGAADTIGWNTITITPEMVGKRVAVFCAFETKDARGRPKPNQIHFLQLVRQAGGIACIVREAVHAVNEIVRFRGA